MSGTTPLTDSFTASTPLVSPCDIAGAPRVPPVFRFPAVPIRWRGARRASLHQPAQAVSKSLRVQGLKRTRRLVLQRAAPRCVYVASPPGVGGGAGSAAFTPSGCSVRLARPQTGCAVSPPSTRACCRPADARLAAARSRAGTVPLNTSSARPQYSPWTQGFGWMSRYRRAKAIPLTLLSPQPVRQGHAAVHSYWSALSMAHTTYM
jgi:hypothetical protein